MLHAVLYLGLALAYCEAAISDLIKGQRWDAVRYFVIAILYSSIAYAVVDSHLADSPLIPSAAEMIVTA